MIDRRAFVFALGTCVAYPSVFASYPKEWTNEAESALPSLTPIFADETRRTLGSSVKKFTIFVA